MKLNGWIVAILLVASLLVGWSVGHSNVVHAAGLPDIGDVELELSTLTLAVHEIRDDIHTLVHNSPTAGLQSGDYKITKMSGLDLAYGTVKAGDVKGFSCVSDVHGDKGDVTSDVECYVLSTR